MAHGVSVVIPAFNAERFVGEAVQSVMAQTLLPVDIVVVDDGSTDRTAELAAAVDPTVQVVRTPNRGVAAARNTGARRARGSVIAFLDADDVWLPTKLF